MKTTIRTARMPAGTEGERGAHIARRPRVLWLLVGLLAILAVGGLQGGLSFVLDPTGASLGAKLSWLERTPVSDFLWPGVFLTVVFGLGGLALIAGLVWRISPGPLARIDRLMGRDWAWVGTIAIGALLVLWIVYELLVMPEIAWLQPFLLAVGLAIAGIPLLPSLRDRYAVPGT